jgi:predicted membrane channel-forming protein YqfA (hemolysin III family)
LNGAINILIESADHDITMKKLAEAAIEAFLDGLRTVYAESMQYHYYNNQQSAKNLTSCIVHSVSNIISIAQRRAINTTAH